MVCFDLCIHAYKTKSKSDYTYTIAGFDLVTTRKKIVIWQKGTMLLPLSASELRYTVLAIDDMCVKDVKMIKNVAFEPAWKNQHSISGDKIILVKHKTSKAINIRHDILVTSKKTYRDKVRRMDLPQFRNFYVVYRRQKPIHMIYYST